MKIISAFFLASISVSATNQEKEYKEEKKHKKTDKNEDKYKAIYSTREWGITEGIPVKEIMTERDN